VTSDPWSCRALGESPRRPGFQSGVDRTRDIATPTSCSRRDSNTQHAD